MAISTDQFIESLGAHHRVLLLGGLAVIAHGLDRMTRDTDIWLEPMDNSTAWSNALCEAMSRAPLTQPFDLAAKQVVALSDIAAVVETYGVVRLLGFDRPLDVFRRPNNLECTDFQEAWEHASVRLGSIRVLDEIDMLITKEGTQRPQDFADISFLESKVHAHYQHLLPHCAYKEAQKLFARYADTTICEFALQNPDPNVQKLALTTLHDLAQDGNPFARDALERHHRTS